MYLPQPPGDVVPPASVLRLSGDETLRAVWRNLSGGVTFEAGSGPRRRFLKWVGHGQRDRPRGRSGPDDLGRQIPHGFPGTGQRP